MGFSLHIPQTSARSAKKKTVVDEWHDETGETSCFTHNKSRQCFSTLVDSIEIQFRPHVEKLKEAASARMLRTVFVGTKHRITQKMLNCIGF